MDLVEPVTFVVSGVAPGCGCTWTAPPTGACGVCPPGEHPHTQRGCDVVGCLCTWSPPPLTDDFDDEPQSWRP